jgi:addiction module HigA family antidote
MADQAHARHRLRPMPPPDYAVPPGETLRERLDELEMSQVELARRAGLTTKHVNRVVQGVASLSADVAQRLEFVTGVPTPVWLRLEADYRSARSRLEVPELDDDDLAWLHDMPVRQLVRAGALPAALIRRAGCGSCCDSSASPTCARTGAFGSCRLQRFGNPGRTTSIPVPSRRGSGSVSWLGVA